jgi:hypothetical protein
MIQFDKLKDQKDEFRMDFLLAKPFSYLAIDNFCEEDKVQELYSQIPDIQTKSRDYVFASNKFEKSKIRDISPLFAELCDDLLSEEFKAFLQYIKSTGVCRSGISRRWYSSGQKEQFP